MKEDPKMVKLKLQTDTFELKTYLSNMTKNLGKKVKTHLKITLKWPN